MPKSTLDYNDVVTFQPVPILIVEDFEAMKLLEDPNYYIIVEILRSRPMTILEIEEAYISRALEHKQVSKKSYNTIYRYLKALEKAGLVIAAGKRVAIGKTASETLFARTARLFHYSGLEECWSESEDTKEIVDRVIEGLKIVYNKDRLSKKCLRDFFSEFIDAIHEQMRILIENGPQDVLYDITSGDWQKMSKTLDYIAIFGILLNQPQMFKKLRDCFVK